MSDLEGHRMPPVSGRSSDNEVKDFREWLLVRHGAAFDVTDEQLRALLDRARISRVMLGRGSAFLVAEEWLLEGNAP